MPHPSPAPPVATLHATLSARLAAPARRDGTVTFVDGDVEVPVRWSEIHQAARGRAVALADRGIGPGDHVCLLGPTNLDLVTTIEAAWLAGATVVVLPLPMRMTSIEGFVESTRRRILGAQAPLVVADAELAPFLDAQPGDPPVLSPADLAGDPATWRPPAVDPDELAILQFTSGSTSEPKGVMLPHRAVLANVDAIASAIDLDPERDVAVSWLPLYHDMGLVGILVSAMVRGVDLVLAGPQTFTASPARWVRWLSDHGGTITAGPNFSWALAARAMRRLDGLDLSPLRVALNGAEPVDPAVVEGLVVAGARHGLRPGAVFPAFGMAEVSIAGTFPEPLAGLRVDVVDAATLENERRAVPSDGGETGTAVKRLARLGRPVDGLEMRVVDRASGAVLDERHVGELQLRGTSLTSGYHRDPAATAAAFDGGWLRTGDLAYLVDGELVLCGRIKDVIIVGGRNVFPEDVERSVAKVDGVRAGNVVAFGVEGRRREGVVVVCEARAADPTAVRDDVAHRVREAIGLPADDIVLVEPGSLPKTSSGKLQRGLCRERYLSDDLVAV